MTAINKFNKSMIYTIRSPHTDQYYIGSTTQILCKRFVDHKAHYKVYLKSGKKFTTSFKIIELGDAYIELLEEVNCENRPQLQRTEGELIRAHKENCVNMVIPGRTKHEYKTDNSDKIKAHMKEYNEVNSDKIKAHKKEYYEANTDKIKAHRKDYYEANSDKIKEERTQYRLENSEKINEQRRAKYAQQKLVKDLKTITI